MFGNGCDFQFILKKICSFILKNKIDNIWEKEYSIQYTQVLIIKGHCLVMDD